MAAALVYALIPLSAAVLVGGYVVESRTPDPYAASVPSPPASLPPLAGDPSATAAGSPTPHPGPTPHPANRQGVAWIGVDGGIVAAGGSATGAGTLTAVTRFDGAVWTDLPPLPESRRDATGAALPNGTLLIAGGLVDGEPAASTLLLPPGADAWVAGPSLPEPRVGMTSAVVGMHVLLVGGSDAGHARDLLVGDLAAGTWTPVTPVPTPITGAATITAGDLVYVLGGRGESGEPGTTAYSYDLATDTWTTLPPAPVPASEVPAAIVDGRIWLLAPVYDQAAGRGSVPVFDPATQRWLLAMGPMAFNPLRADVALPLTDGRILMLASSTTGFAITFLVPSGLDLTDP